MRARFLIIALLAAFGAVALGAAVPAAGAEHSRARDAVRDQQIRPLGEVLSVVQGRFPGRVMDVRLQRGQWVYRLKLLGFDGRVRVIAVDARTARILSPSRLAPVNQWRRG